MSAHAILIRANGTSRMERLPFTIEQAVEFRLFRAAGLLGRWLGAACQSPDGDGILFRRVPGPIVPTFVEVP